jgi:RNA polymerase sigma-70 factor (ECF subfamily)
LNDNYYIAQVIKGNLNAYTPLVEKYRQYVLALVQRTCPHPAEAEELAQDVFVKAYEHLETFRGTAAFTTWLYRIAFNTAVSHARKKRRYGVSIDRIDLRTFIVSDEEIRDNQDDAMRKEQIYITLERLLESLPADEQMLISLYYKQELNMDEVAYISGLSLSNAKVKIHRIRKKLYLLFQEEHKNE